MRTKQRASGRARIAGAVRTACAGASLLVSTSTAPAQPDPAPILDSTGSTEPAPTFEPPRAGCVTAGCHPAIKDHAELHAPVRANGCDGCHQLVDAAAHEYEPLPEADEMCATCHMPDEGKALVGHEPFRDGSCLVCHEPHGGTAITLLRGATTADACLPCHGETTGTDSHAHVPESAGGCAACHDAHEAPLPGLLRATGRELCIGCHEGTAAEIASFTYEHAPAADDCEVCHAPHDTGRVAMLRASPEVLCTGCHAEIGDIVHNASTAHEAVTSERSCLNCHASHGGSHALLLREDVDRLCFECHNRQVTTPDGTVLVNMQEVVESGASLHSAITQRGCAECHEIHGGGHRRLLTNEYPSDVYYPFAESAYALCFSCHDRQMVLLSRTDAATGFRNGTTNLHYTHVNRDKKGRSCRICHDSHAAPREKHIRDSIPWGTGVWDLPIGFEPSSDGGRCATGCHRELEYNRNDPVAYPRPVRIREPGDGPGRGPGRGPGGGAGGEPGG